MISRLRLEERQTISGLRFESYQKLSRPKKTRLLPNWQFHDLSLLNASGIVEYNQKVESIKMPLKFPETSHIKLKNPPISEVIAQTRYTPMLEIGEGAADYQKLVRSSFPIFGTRSSLLQGKEAELAPRDLVFVDSFEKSQISLGISSLAVHTNQYEGWDKFKTYIELATKSFLEVYGNFNVIRIGLRYINEIKTPNTVEGLAKGISRELIPEIESAVWDFPLHISKALLFEDGENRLRIRLSLDKEPETKLLLDYDYFKEFKQQAFHNSEEISSIYDSFHNNVYDAFHWSVKQELIDAFS